MKNVIHVVCATDNKYIPFCGITITSIFENNKFNNVYVHVFGSKLNSVNEDLLKKIGDKYEQKVVVCNFEEYISSEYASTLLQAASLHPKHHVSIVGYNRFFIAKILPDTITRAIYIDCDVIVCQSLEGLWEEDINNYAIGCVESHTVIIDDNKQCCLQANLNPLKDRYFNSGVMLMNLTYWRQHNLMEQCVFCVREMPDLSRKLCDQDILNYVLRDKKKMLHPKYNVQNLFFSDRRLLKNYSDIYDSVEQRVIIHYLSSVKPWHRECDHPLKNEWLKYMSISEWNNYRIRYKLNWKQRLVYRLKLIIRYIFCMVSSTFRKKHPLYDSVWRQ